MADRNRITRIAIVGAGGNCSRFIAEALLMTGKHTITAITRTDSKSILLNGVISKTVDYNRSETLVEALRGQDALVITLSGHAPKETELQLIAAAGEAGVAWILPNEWSPDTANEALVRDVFVFQPKVHTRKAITDLGKSLYISVCTGFWYEYTLGNPAAFGIDLLERSVTFYDEGDTKISVSTWPQIGRAVAALLSLPVKSEASGKGACLESFKNRVVYIKSFTVSQKDMWRSPMRTSGTKEDEWTITKQPAQERYSSGLKEIKEGQRIGYAKMMYSRVFYSDGCGDFEHNKSTLNSLLGLPEESIDDATKVAIERSKASNLAES